MPKYYVQSGQLQSIIDRKDTKTAALAVLSKLHGRGLIISPRICVSERGWYNDKCFDTDTLLKILYDDEQS